MKFNTSETDFSDQDRDATHALPPTIVKVPLTLDERDLDLLNEIKPISTR
ncbi:hypothetical protein [Flexibacterium corallicola]|nr:hypothetical protein [Pseudovibrio sp. M1P-2-3]